MKTHLITALFLRLTAKNSRTSRSPASNPTALWSSRVWEFRRFTSLNCPKRFRNDFITMPRRPPHIPLSKPGDYLRRRSPRSHRSHRRKALGKETRFYGSKSVKFCRMGFWPTVRLRTKHFLADRQEVTRPAVATMMFRAIPAKRSSFRALPAATLQKASVFKFRRMPTGHILIKTPAARAGLWRSGYLLN